MADEDTELMINDRLSFQDFLGFNLSSSVSDAKTIWAYKNKLAMSGKASVIFDMFDSLLTQKGLITKRGSIVNASFVDVPRQRNTKTQNATVKRDDIPEEWLADDPKSSHKLAQKDIDARWAKRGTKRISDAKITSKWIRTVSQLSNSRFQMQRCMTVRLSFSR